MRSLLAYLLGWVSLDLGLGLDKVGKEMFLLWWVEGFEGCDEEGG